MEHFEILKRALDGGGINVPSGVVGLFEEYRKIILEWNQKINLISRRDEGRIVTRHFLESVGFLKVVEFPRDSRVMDLGSGAGFPGIPMKLVRPDFRLVLVESKRKRVFFLGRVVEMLGMKDVEIVLGRVEELSDEIGFFDFVVSRSVADLVTLVKWSWKFLKSSGGRLVVVKGPDVEKELKDLNEVVPKLGIKNCQVKRYNPFPAIFQLRESFVVVVEKG